MGEAEAVQRQSVPSTEGEGGMDGGSNPGRLRLCEPGPVLFCASADVCNDPRRRIRKRGGASWERIEKEREVVLTEAGSTRTGFGFLVCRRMGP
jgi:hypothetical protein